MHGGILDLWRAMGPVARLVVVLLGGMSIAALSIGFDRALKLIQFRRAAQASASKLQAALEAGRLAEAAQIGTGAIARVVSAGVQEHLSSVGRAPDPAEALESVEAALERALEAEGTALRRGLGALATIGSTAPFVGLFGTIVGIVDAFREIARSGAGGLGAVSAGIAEALVTTGLGILVAIVAIVLFNWASGRAEDAQADLADVASVVLDRVRKAGWRKEAT